MNYLRGLLKTPRKCPRDHEDMERQDGLWAIPQVRLGATPGIVATGISYVAALYRCKACGALELVDEEIPNGGA